MKASPTLKDEAFGLKLSCLETPFGCSSAEEIAPTAATQLKEDESWKTAHPIENAEWNTKQCGRPDWGPIYR